MGQPLQRPAQRSHRNFQPLAVLGHRAVGAVDSLLFGHVGKLVIGQRLGRFLELTPHCIYLFLGQRTSDEPITTSHNALLCGIDQNSLGLNEID